MYDFAYVFLHSDEPWDRTAVTEMLRSARRVFPDANFVQLSDSKTPIHPWAHNQLKANVEVTDENRGNLEVFLIAEHLRKSKRPVIYSDIHCLWCTEIPGADKVGAVPAQMIRKVDMGLCVSFPGEENRTAMINFARALDGGGEFKALNPAQSLNEAVRIANNTRPLEV